MQKHKGRYQPVITQIMAPLAPVQGWGGGSGIFSVAWEILFHAWLSSLQVEFFFKKKYHCYVLTSFHVYKMQPANTSRGQSSVGLTAWATLHSTGLDSWVFSYCYRCRFRWHGILNMLGPTQDFSCSATQNQKNLFERESQGVAEQKQRIYSTLTFCKGALK